MRFLFLACSVVLIPICLQQEPSPAEIHQPAFSPEAPSASVKNQAPQNRKQRSVFAFTAGNGFGFKQTALDLIFGKINQAIAAATAKAAQLDRFNAARNRALGIGVQCRSCESGRGTRPPPPPPPTTTDEVPQFDRDAVRLEVSPELIQRGFRLTSNISKLIGSVILNAADRKQQLVEAAKPFIAAKLGLDISAASFTTPQPAESLVPRLGPPLGGAPPNASDSSSPAPEDVSANRIDRSAPGAF